MKLIEKLNLLSLSILMIACSSGKQDEAGGTAIWLSKKSRLPAG
jgi:hypothetical protein